MRALYRFDFAGAQVDLDKAVALNPGDAWVLHRSAVVLGVLGKLPEAIAREEQAVALDPLSAEICMRLGFFLVADQQLARARPLYDKALAIAPNSSSARYHLGELELLEHQPERALDIFRQTRVEEFSWTGQAKAEYSLGHEDVSERILKQLISKQTYFSIARVYAWRGDKDKAFQWAERAAKARDASITWLKIATDFRSLRGDPRYKALLKKMNLPSNESACPDSLPDSCRSRPARTGQQATLTNASPVFELNVQSGGQSGASRPQPEVQYIQMGSRKLPFCTDSVRMPG